MRNFITNEQNTFQCSLIFSQTLMITLSWVNFPLFDLTNIQIALHLNVHMFPSKKSMLVYNSTKLDSKCF